MGFQYFGTAAATYESAGNGASADTAVGPIQSISAATLLLALPLTARDANCNVTAQLQHGPAAAGPWLNYGSPVTDTTDAVALLSRRISRRSSGPILPYVRLLISVANRLGAGNPQVGFTARPGLLIDTGEGSYPTLALVTLASGATLQSEANGARRATSYVLPGLFTGAQICAALNVTARDANTDLDVTVDHSAAGASPWAVLGTVVNDTTDNTGLLSGYVSEDVVGPILPYTRVTVGVADRGAAAQRSITCTLYVLPDRLTSAPAATDLAATGVTVDPGGTGVTVDPGGTSLTVDPKAANNQATNHLGFAVSLGAPAASNTSAVHAGFAGNDAGNAFPGPFTNPDVPRCVSVTFAAGWDGGNVTVDGTDQWDVVVQEVIVAAAGTTVMGSQVFKTVTGATKGAVGAAADTASIGTSDRLGVGGTGAGPALSAPIGVVQVDGVSEDGALWDAAEWVQPNTQPNGARVYWAWYPAQRTILQDPHDHSVTDPGHGHNVTDPGHGHNVTDPTHRHV
ncbi:hypothetical protein L6R50_14840 [Myxococcota bacterium]|nr:hypothetical protein [Myxococcota bacterium]